MALNSAHAAHMDDDAILQDRCLAGDEQAFETLYRKYYGKVFAIAKGVLLDEEDAADATQEIFRLVHRNLRRFDRRSKFSTWLHRVAVNRSIQEARSRKRHKSELPIESAEHIGSEDNVQILDPQIASALRALAPQDRAILALFYWQDLTLEEIAAALNCSPNAAKTRLFRARERFRTHYLEEAP
jgi:RNA polymerase sigma-70 factor (ECF subfamily)